MAKTVQIHFEGKLVTCSHVVHSRYGVNFFNCERIANRHADLTRGTLYPAEHVAEVTNGGLYLYAFSTKVMERGAIRRTGPGGDDLVLWADGTLCFYREVHEYTWMSDDYEVVPFGTDRWLELSKGA